MTTIIEAGQDARRSRLSPPFVLGAFGDRGWIRILGRHCLSGGGIAPITTSLR